MFKNTLTVAFAALALMGTILTVTQSAQAGLGRAVADLAVTFRPELRAF